MSACGGSTEFPGFSLPIGDMYYKEHNWRVTLPEIQLPMGPRKGNLKAVNNHTAMDYSIAKMLYGYFNQNLIGKVLWLMGLNSRSVHGSRRTDSCQDFEKRAKG